MFISDTAIIMIFLMNFFSLLEGVKECHLAPSFKKLLNLKDNLNSLVEKYPALAHLRENFKRNHLSFITPFQIM